LRNGRCVALPTSRSIGSTRSPGLPQTPNETRPMGMSNGTLVIYRKPRQAPAFFELELLCATLSRRAELGNDPMRARAVAFLASFAVLSGCGGGGAGSTAGSAPIPIPTPSPPVTASVSQTIVAATGGSISTVLNGKTVTVVVPAGAQHTAGSRSPH